MFVLLVYVLLTIEDIHTAQRLARQFATVKVIVAVCAVLVNGFDVLDSGDTFFV